MRCFNETHTRKGSRIKHRGVKTRIGPPYPHVRREGDWNGTVSRNNRNKVGPVSVLGREHRRTLRNVYGVGTRP